MSGTTIATKRIYEPPAASDGVRILVDRLWPRGVSKEKARLDLWLKELAPDNALRIWFNHEPEKWPQFKQRYYRQLAQNPAAVQALHTLLDATATSTTVTLLYGARDTEYNNAVALKEYLLTKKRHA